MRDQLIEIGERIAPPVDLAAMLRWDWPSRVPDHQLDDALNAVAIRLSRLASTGEQDTPRMHTLLGHRDALTTRWQRLAHQLAGPVAGVA